MRQGRTRAVFLGVFAALAPATARAAGDGGPDGSVLMAALLALGLAILGGTLAQGRAAAAAYDGICRNPAAAEKVFTPMILGLALIESLVILGFVALNMVMFA
ncbi:MAG: ATP synthase F0 subunit C [Nannocystales bacterium]